MKDRHPSVKPVVCMGLLIAAAAARSATGQFVVDAGGAGTHTTIQAAIDAALDGDQIVVNPGVYAETIDFLGKLITVRSTVPTDGAIVAATILDAGRAGHAVSFVSAETTGTRLEGLTIRNGLETHGGGIYCVNGSSPTIRFNRVVDNFCVLHGGGVYCAGGASPVIVANTIENNVCEGRGGGLYAESSSAFVEDNTIRGNNAGCSTGGGIHLGIGTDAVVVSYNLLVGNMAVTGGALQIKDASPLVRCNRIIGNIAGVRGGGVACVNASPLLESNLISGNQADFGSAVDCNGSDAVFRCNTFVGNLTDQAAVLLAINLSNVELIGNIMAFHAAGVALQAITGSTIEADFNCLFANTSGNSSGSVVLGPNNILVDPMLTAIGAWGAGPVQSGPTCGDIDLRASLSGAEPRQGRADYTVGVDSRKFRVDVQGFTRGAYVVSLDLVNVGTINVGTVNVGPNGAGLLNYDTDDGTMPPGFPSPGAGSVVDVGGLAAGTLQFVGGELGSFWTPGDVHLLPGSPCINAVPPAMVGATPVDLDGQPRVSGLRSDMGADELRPAGTGDANRDGDVDLSDAAAYQRCVAHGGAGLVAPDCAQVDMDASGHIDPLDWAQMVAMLTGPAERWMAPSGEPQLAPSGTRRPVRQAVPAPPSGRRSLP